MGVDACVVYNKNDLGIGDARYELDTYFDIGYDVVACSTTMGTVRQRMVSGCLLELRGQRGDGRDGRPRGRRRHRHYLVLRGR